MTLDITANAGSVYTLGKFGNVTTIKAGTDINLDSVFSYGTISLIARNDVLLNSLYSEKGLDVLAGRNVSFDITAFPNTLQNPATVWVEEGGINIAAGYQIDRDWNAVRDGGNLVPTASGGNISFNGDSAVYIGNTAAPYNNGLTLQAHGNIDLRVLETYGPVSITSTLTTAPVINLWNPIGPRLVDTLGTIEPRADLGVASFTLNSPAAGTIVNMQGVRAEGDVSISIGGQLTSSRDITSGGTKVITASGGANITPADIGTQEALDKPIPPAPPFAPGPNVGPPGPLMALTALPAEPPGTVSVPETGVPAGSSQLDVNFDPERWVGAETVSEVIPGEETDEDGQTRKTMHFSGGRGLIKEADLGQR
jgi:hypothetical protein